MFLFLLKSSYIKGKKIFKLIFYKKFSVKEINNVFELKLINVMAKDQGGIYFFNIKKLVKK